MFDFLKLARIVMAATFLAVAFGSSPASAQQSTDTTITDKSPTGELAFWNKIKDSNDVSSFKAYLENFPNGMFYDVALAKFNSLGGNTADLKANTNGEASSPGTGSSTKSKTVLVKKTRTPVVQKRTVSHKIRKKPRVRIFKKAAHKNIATHPRHIVRRKIVTPPTGGGGGGSGGGGGWNG